MDFKLEICCADLHSLRAAIAGGDDIEPASCGHPECPKCKSEDTEQTGKNASYVFWKCRTCGYQWKVNILI